jgi:hypothetical protein
MNTPLIIMLSIIALGGLYVLFPVMMDTFQRYREMKVVKCPETAGSAGVWIDARYAAVTSAFGKPRLRVGHCSLWPERKGCNQDCLNP